MVDAAWRFTGQGRGYRLGPHNLGEDVDQRALTRQLAPVLADRDVVAEIRVTRVGRRSDGAPQSPTLVALEQIGHAAALALRAVGSRRTDQKVPAVAGQCYRLAEIAGVGVRRQNGLARRETVAGPLEQMHGLLAADRQPGAVGR